jgi:hypothetical protein
VPLSNPDSIFNKIKRKLSDNPPFASFYLTKIGFSVALKIRRSWKGGNPPAGADRMKSWWCPIPHLLLLLLLLHPSHQISGTACFTPPTPLKLASLITMPGILPEYHMPIINTVSSFINKISTVVQMAPPQKGHAGLNKINLMTQCPQYHRNFRPVNSKGDLVQIILNHCARGSATSYTNDPKWAQAQDAKSFGYNFTKIPDYLNCNWLGGNRDSVIILVTGDLDAWDELTLM